ncbi:MAG: bifunctional (p)ppGpp synthetase/guanosine-3',5'-bis(diphosphate) 3'-pyrophosphohydrolase [Ignavibacteriae bacterium]|nr:bifunctional (p)ppGpp synthetase/guanosine-3',5'-bis(diphosphate) 3'-pyrophosphohydrolase [Ignavibacteriota bacterium]
MAKYNQTTISRIELEESLVQHCNPMELNKVMSAFELSESVHEGQIRGDGSAYFYHCARVCKILLNEMGITDIDVLAAALLHDVIEDSPTLSISVLEYNFGRYVAYLVETLTKDLERREIEPDEVDKEHIELLKQSSSDCLLIKLAARLDNFRCLEFNLKRNPHRYIQETEELYIPLVENSDIPHLTYLVIELKKERNKFLG